MKQVVELSHFMSAYYEGFIGLREVYGCLFRLWLQPTLVASLPVPTVLQMVPRRAAKDNRMSCAADKCLMLRDRLKTLTA